MTELTEGERLVALETRVDEHGRRLDEGAAQMNRFLWFQIATLTSALGGLIVLVADHLSKHP